MEKYVGEQILINLNNNLLKWQECLKFKMNFKWELIDKSLWKEW